MIDAAKNAQFFQNAIALFVCFCGKPRIGENTSTGFFFSTPTSEDTYIMTFMTAVLMRHAPSCTHVVMMLRDMTWPKSVKNQW